MINLDDLVQMVSILMGCWVTGWAMGFCLYMFRRASYTAT